MREMRFYNVLYFKKEEIFILFQKCSGFGWVPKPKAEPRTQPETQSLNFRPKTQLKTRGFVYRSKNPAQCRSLGSKNQVLEMAGSSLVIGKNNVDVDS